MQLIYIDDSGDPTTAVYSALFIPEREWRQAYRNLKEFRRDIKQRYGVYIHKELHATELVAGRGQISSQIVTKFERSLIFRDFISTISQLLGIRIINACGAKSQKMKLFEWTINRINRTLQAQDDRGMLIIDEGSEGEYTRLVRKMTVFNPIPSQFDVWLDTGDASKNVPIDRIIEDPFFKESGRSFFLQCADCVAFSLLRRERPLASRNRYNINKCFDLLDPVLVKVAFKADPSKQGIIRA